MAHSAIPVAAGLVGTVMMLLRHRCVLNAFITWYFAYQFTKRCRELVDEARTAKSHCEKLCASAHAGLNAVVVCLLLRDVLKLVRTTN